MAGARIPGTPTKVWFVTSTWPSPHRPGTGTFTRDLFDALSARPGLDMRLWAPAPDSSSATLRSLAVDLTLSECASKGIRGLPFIARFLLRLARDSVGVRGWADVLHVNWTPPVMATWLGGRPTVVTVHGSDLDLLQRNRIVRELCSLCLRQSVLVAVAPWQTGPLSAMFPHVPVRVVPNGVAGHWFRCPPPRPEPAGAPLFLFVGRVTAQKLGDLPDWATRLEESGVGRFRYVGPREPQARVSRLGEYVAAVSQQELTDHLAQARAFVSLSIHEGRPSSVLEAMAAGRAVVLSDIPAHRELVDSGRNGFLVRNFADFQSAIERLSNLSMANELGRNARNWIRGNVGGWNDCASRYAQVYEECMARCRP